MSALSWFFGGQDWEAFDQELKEIHDRLLRMEAGLFSS